MAKETPKNELVLDNKSIYTEAGYKELLIRSPPTKTINHINHDYIVHTLSVMLGIVPPSQKLQIYSSGIDFATSPSIIRQRTKLILRKLLDFKY